MPFNEWTFSLTVQNQCGRRLQLKTDQLPWGKRRGNFAQTIEPWQDATYQWYSPGGAPYGIEFGLVFADVPSPGSLPWGSMEIKVDIPFAKHENISWCKTTGLLEASGFVTVPNGAHNHSTTVKVAYKDISGVPDKPEYDWSNIEKLPVNDTVPLEDFIPEKNLISTDNRLLFRTQPIEIPQSQWSEITEAKLDNAAKQQVVTSYFTVCVYKLKKAHSLSIARNQERTDTVVITHQTTERTSETTQYALESLVQASVGEEKKGSVGGQIKANYSVTSLKEYIDSKSRTTTETVTYRAENKDRVVVFWDLDKVIFIYRKNKDGSIVLAGLSDYYVASAQKTYDKE